MFTAPVSGFDAATDLRVTNGRVSVPPEGYGRNYEIMIIPESGEKRLVVQVLADVARSVRGWNGNVASEALSLTVNEAQAKGHYIPDVSPRNLARAPGVIASQSSSVSARGADKAIDGNIDGNSANGSISHTGTGTADRYQLWWQVDLGEAEYIDEIRLYNRLDCCANRASNFFVFVSNAPLIGDKLPQLWQEDVFYQRHHHGQMGHPTTLEVDRVERYVRVQLVGTQEPLHMAEVEVLGHDLPTPLPDLLNFRFPRPASRVATEAIEITEGVPFDISVRFSRAVGGFDSATDLRVGGQKSL